MGLGGKAWVGHGHNWSIVMHVAEISHRNSLRVTRKRFVIFCVRGAGAVLYVIIILTMRMTTLG